MSTASFPVTVLPVELTFASCTLSIVPTSYVPVSSSTTVVKSVELPLTANVGGVASCIISIELDAVLPFSAASCAAFAGMYTDTVPSDVGVTLNVYTESDVATGFVASPPVTVLSDDASSNPDTDSLNVAVNGIGDTFVGPGVAVLVIVTVGSEESCVMVNVLEGLLPLLLASCVTFSANVYGYRLVVGRGGCGETPGCVVDSYKRGVGDSRAGKRDV